MSETSLIAFGTLQLCNVALSFYISTYFVLFEFVLYSIHWKHFSLFIMSKNFGEHFAQSLKKM